MRQEKGKIKLTQSGKTQSACGDCPCAGRKTLLPYKEQEGREFRSRRRNTQTLGNRKLREFYSAGFYFLCVTGAEVIC